MNAANASETAMTVDAPAVKRVWGMRQETLALGCLFLVGVVLRLCVLLTAEPFNPDRHFQVIRHIYRHAALPTSNVIDQSYQPPLYYVLMVVLNRFMGLRPEPVHVASFVFSVANLVLIGWIVRHRRFAEIVPSQAARVLAFAIAAALPQMIMFASFISNDTMMMLVGTIIVIAAAAYLERPTPRRRGLLAVGVAAGLLTKGTFLLTGPALAVVVAIVESRRQARARVALAVATFCAIWLTLGCYKYVENTVRLGRPFVHNQDNSNPIARAQQNTWRGLRTIYDINVFELMNRPIINRKQPSSYPILFYATFWYHHIPVESSYRGGLRGYETVGTLIYGAAIVPTLTFFGGLGAALMLLGRSAWRWLRAGVGDAGEDRLRRDLVFTATMLLASNFVIVMAAGLKYNNWSSFHGRLFFQSAAPLMLFFAIGVCRAMRRKWLGVVVLFFGWATFVMSLVFFIVEIGVAQGWLRAGIQRWPT